MFFVGLLSIVFTIASSVLLVRLFRAKYFSEAVLLFFLFSTGLIVLQGFAVSCLKKLDSLGYWFLAGIFTLLVILLITRILSKMGLVVHGDTVIFLRIGDLWVEFLSVGKVKALLLGLLLITAAVCGLLNLALVLLTAPFGHDSLAYWIGRIGYFLQQGSLDYLRANQFWIAHRPKIQTILMIYSFLISGRNENLMQIVNYLAYWVTAGAVYYICRMLNQNRVPSLFAALIFSILINPLMVSTTTQNDMLLATYIGIFIGFGFAFRKTGQFKYLLIAALSLAVAFNTKEIFVFCVPAISIIALYAIFPAKKICEISFRGIIKPYLKTLSIFAACSIIFAAIFAFPSGYWDNLKRYNNFIVVPKQQAEGNYFNLGSPAKYLKASAMNALRFAVDFINLDGMPAQNKTVQTAQRVVKELPEKFFENINLDLATNYAPNHGDYIKSREPVASAVLSYWGVLGFLFVLPAVLLHFFNIFKSETVPKKDFRILSLAVIIFFISQAMIGEYDVWRGRYFTPMAVMATPLTISFFVSRKKLVGLFLATVVIFGCFSAFSAVLLRNNSEIINYNGKKSIFLRDRYEQLLRDSGGGDATIPYRKLEELVPQTATLTQWVVSPPYEYMYFGPELLRRVIPLTFWEDGIIHIPYNADYMVYDSTNMDPRLCDIHLGNNQMLRKLLPPMRFEDNLALKQNGGYAVVYANAPDFPAETLNDGTDRQWGANDAGDIAFAIARKKPFNAHTIQLVLYSPGERNFLRDISVVAADSPKAALSKYKVLRAKIYGSDKGFQKKITIPEGRDGQIVMIEIDKQDALYRSYRVFGIACFSGKDKSYRQNYTAGQSGIFVREILISEKAPEYFQPLVEARQDSLYSEKMYEVDCWYFEPASSWTDKPVDKYRFTKELNSLLIRPEKNLALKQNGGFAGASSCQNNFPFNALNDGTSRPWGGDAEKDLEDTVFFIAHKEPYLPGIIQVVLFSLNGNAHIRDLSVVATDDLDQPVDKWVILKSKISGQSNYTKKITIPEGLDEDVVTIEIDKNDPAYHSYKVFGLACLSKSADYERNYISLGNGVYVREILISE
jgi:4-amino-4-deoxy-L-arabinose transferase-like glycosyltransferase